jgi:Kef-type K+ transport system membrane component KefB
VTELTVLAAIHVEPAEFLAVVGTSAVAGTLSALVTARGLLLPAVVVELLLGVVIGPQVLGLDVSEFIEFFAGLGLGMLFFYAGYEATGRSRGPRRSRPAAWREAPREP